MNIIGKYARSIPYTRFFLKNGTLTQRISHLGSNIPGHSLRISHLGSNIPGHSLVHFASRRCRLIPDPKGGLLPLLIGVLVASLLFKTTQDMTIAMVIMRLPIPLDAPFRQKRTMKV